MQGRNRANSEMQFQPLGSLLAQSPDLGRDYHCSGEKWSYLTFATPSSPPTKAEAIIMLGKRIAPCILWLQLLDPWPHSDRVATAVEPGRSPSSHLAATSNLCIPLKVASRIPQEKMWSVLTSDSVLPVKPLGTCRLIEMFLHKDKTSRPGYVTDLLNFKEVIFESKKKKKERKKEEYVPNERTR